MRLGTVPAASFSLRNIGLRACTWSSLELGVLFLREHLSFHGSPLTLGSNRFWAFGMSFLLYKRSGIVIV